MPKPAPRHVPSQRGQGGTGLASLPAPRGAETASVNRNGAAVPTSESSAPWSCQEGSGPPGSLGEASAPIRAQGPDKRQRRAIGAPRRCRPSRTPRAGPGTRGRRAHGELGRPEGAVLVAHGCQALGDRRVPALEDGCQRAAGTVVPWWCWGGGDGCLEGMGGGGPKLALLVCCALGPIYSLGIDKGGG